MFMFSRLSKFMAVAALLAVGGYALVVSANHSWGGYHWARTANPFTLKLGDNVSSAWDVYLATASTDWNTNTSATTTVLSTTVVPGQTNPKVCRASSGRVEVCNSAYGNTGWLGVAQIWVSGLHIAKGTVKLNDTYFKTAPYNTPAWKQFVACQEIGHIFGLDHQDVDFRNPNLGTCMDYTSDPDGTLKNPDQLSNLKPNEHDYEELAIIYMHIDAFTTLLSKQFAAPASIQGDDSDVSRPSEWGKVIRKSADGRSALHERDLGKGNKVFTFVIWAD